MNASDEDPFTQALRGDLPAPADETRIRSRLVSAGVLAGTVVAPVVGAAASGGIATKVVAWPLAAKVGASLAVVGVVALPVVSRMSHPSAPSLGNVTVSTTAVPVGPAKSPARASESAPEPATPSEPLAEPTVAMRESTKSTVREPTKASVATPVAKSLPSVAAFSDVPPAPAPLDEGSLRAETALMERALSALKRDDVATARTALAEHALRFPNGHLVRERERALTRTLEKETARHVQ